VKTADRVDLGTSERTSLKLGAWSLELK